MDFDDYAILAEALEKYQQLWKDELHKSLGQRSLKQGDSWLIGPINIAQEKLLKISRVSNLINKELGMPDYDQQIEKSAHPENFEPLMEDDEIDGTV